MKKHGLKIWLTLLGLFTAFLTICAATAGASPEMPELTCDYASAGSEYFNPSRSTENVMELYHTNINVQFNNYIRMMITSHPDDPRGKAPVNEDACLAGDNYSTYCVAYALLMNRQFGYMQYRKALDCRRNIVFDGAAERDQWNSYIGAMIYGESSEANVESIYQGQKILEISARLEGINREINDAKAALDQTLAAYMELKTAWPMHKKYIEIYENLIKYRDKLAEIRHHVEEFPSKFIDATTTQCT